MNKHSIIRRNLRRLKSKHKSDWNYILNRNNHYLCPDKHYTNKCISVFQDELFKKNKKNDIYIRRNKIQYRTPRKLNEN